MLWQVGISVSLGKNEFVIENNLLDINLLISYMGTYLSNRLFDMLQSAGVNEISAAKVVWPWSCWCNKQPNHSLPRPSF